MAGELNVNYDARYIDLPSALARLRGNKALYRKMLGMFVRSTDSATLEEGLAEGDLQKAGDAAHAIKGVAGNLSLTALFELSSELMTQLRHGEPNPDTLSAYREAVIKTAEAVNDVAAQIDAGA